MISKREQPKKKSSKSSNQKKPTKSGNKSSAKTSKSKKTVKPPNKKKNPLKYFFKRVEIILAVGGTAAGLIALQDYYNKHKDDSYSNFGYESLAFARDSDDDEYDGEIPVYDDGKLIGTLDEDSFVLVDQNDNEVEGQYKIIGISDMGEVLQGVTDQDYIDIIEDITPEDIEEYTKHIYEVTSDDYVNVRNATIMDKDTKIGKLVEGELVFGGDSIVSKDNDFMWVPIFYVSDGELQKAYVCSDYIERVDGKSKNPSKENKIEKMVVNTSNANFADLNLRSARIINSESLITGIPHGEVVETTGKDKVVENGVKWVEVKYKTIDGEDIIGWVSDGYLNEYDLVEYVVDIDASNGNKLNVREEPGLNSDVIATIEGGTHLNIQKSNIENTIASDDIDWVKIVLRDGSQGYVASKYLKEFEKEDESKKEKPKSTEIVDEIVKNTRANENGKVIGIDVSSMTPEELKMLLTKDDAIPDNCYCYIDNRTHKTKDLSGKISYVYIKIGARGYGKEGRMADNGDNYVYLAEVCEELGIPYGFYFYSTALDIEEADEELAFINKLLREVDGRDYNLLPFALDVELEGGSRLKGHDVTDVMAYWANQAEPNLGKVVLYTDARHLAECQDKLIDMNEFNSQLISGPAKVWLVGMRDADTGNIIQARQNKINEIADDTDIWMSQCLLDTKLIEDSNRKADINIIDRRRFVETLYESVDSHRNKDGNIAKTNSDDDIRNF
ncbi:MAG: SH3 domain-containing protein [Clostridia bacterium]|nr:SH3 domain-containing protein [Clostridia bacterium]